MSYFTAKMHQIRFRLGLCPRPRWGAYSAPPDLLAGFRGAYFWGEGEGKGDGKGRERGKSAGEGDDVGKGGDGKGRREEDGKATGVPPLLSLHFQHCSKGREDGRLEKAEEREREG